MTSTMVTRRRARGPVALVRAFVQVACLGHAFMLMCAQSAFGDFANVSVLVPLLGTVAYASAIIALRACMRDRLPVSGLEPAMLMYNLYQMALNVWMVCMYLKGLSDAGMSFVGNDMSERSSHVGFVTFVHYNNKYAELVDTLWLVLRKKDSQVSFLHVYHHVSMVWAWFIVVKYANAGDAHVGAMVNSCMHVLMYGYYSMAIMRMRCHLKKLLTFAQMAQFVFCAGHAVYCIVLGSYPAWICCIEIVIMASLLYEYLFGQFYARSYKTKRAML